MRLHTTLCLIIALFAHHAFSSDAKCKKLLPLISDKTVKEIDSVLTFKEYNNNQWHSIGIFEGLSFTLKANEVKDFTLAWKIKNHLNANDSSEGEIKCEIPSRWQLYLSSPLKIIYPKACYEENLSRHNVFTFSSFYLGKSKYRVNPT